MIATPILDALGRPGDVKRLTDEQQQVLCRELRAKIEHTVLKNGGHLASNLGVVELTVALHSVFALPKDKILWDVGHQCYAHKLLTGRRMRFDTLRTKGGISGFPKPTESEYDNFVSGHASTALAAAMGMKEAMVQKGEQGEVIAVVGDGALTGGLTYEAINNLGASGEKVILILNDNEMAISENQGAVATYLAEIRNRPAYFTAKRVTRASLDRIPVIGVPAKELITRAKTMVKHMVYPMTFFEQFGFVYMGPVDGHNITSLKAVLRQARLISEPVIVHVQTQKGHGYLPAEQKPGIFHGVSPNNGPKKADRQSFAHVFGKTLCEMAEQDKRICAITAAMEDGTGLDHFSKRFKAEKRFFDVGIAEGYATTFAAGMSAGGSLPVFAVYSTFLQRAYDQLIHDIAIMGEHVVIGVDRAGIVGEDGETHQGIFDAAFLSTIPGITTYSPATLGQLRADLRCALNEHNGPVVVRYPRGSEPDFPDMYRPTNAPFDYFQRRGANKLIISYGRIGAEAAEAVRRLTGISLLLLNRITPLPQEAVTIAAGYDSVYFAEEGVRTGGIGQQFASMLLETGYRGAFKLRAIEGFVPQGTVSELLGDLGLTAAGLRVWIMEGKDDEATS